MPYEAISEEHFEELTASLREIDFSRRQSGSRGDDERKAQERAEEIPDKFCDTDSCELDSAPPS